MEAAPLLSQELPGPVHVAVIMDGNGRWARCRGLPRTAGHRRGAESVRTTVETAIRAGVRYLTLFGFSSENWKRPAEEISDLTGLLRHYLTTEIDFLIRNSVRLRIIGDRERFGAEIVALFRQAEEATVSNQRLDLIIALNYGGRAEIVEAARKVAADVASGRLALEAIDEKTISSRLYTAGIPDPDLLIRTSGEQRVSNFLLWQVAYAEFVFIDTLWPDFSSEDFLSAVREFQGRDRRYGAARA